MRKRRNSMTEPIRSTQQAQVETAMSMLGVPSGVEQKTNSVSTPVFKEQAIATIERHIQAVPLNKIGEVAEKISAMAGVKKTDESKLGWIRLAIDRCINFITGHGAVTSAEWAQHVADKLQRIALIQEHFKKVKNGEMLFPPNIQSAIVKLSPDEIKKLVQENVFNIERLRDLDLYQKFEQTMRFTLSSAQ